MQQTNPREYKNQKAPRCAELLEKYLYKSITYILNGGRGEIRTHGGLSSSPVFKTGAFNRSATLPLRLQR